MNIFIEKYQPDKWEEMQWIKREKEVMLRKKEAALRVMMQSNRSMTEHTSIVSVNRSKDDVDGVVMGCHENDDGAALQKRRRKLVCSYWNELSCLLMFRY